MTIEFVAIGLVGIGGALLIGTAVWSSWRFSTDVKGAGARAAGGFGGDGGEEGSAMNIQLSSEQEERARQASQLLVEIAEQLSGTNDQRIEVRLEAIFKADYSKPSRDWYSCVAQWRVAREHSVLYAQSDATLAGAIRKLDLLTEQDRARIRLENAKMNVRMAAAEVRRLAR